MTHPDKPEVVQGELEAMVRAAIAAAPGYWRRGEAQKAYEYEDFRKIVEAALSCRTPTRPRAGEVEGLVERYSLLGQDPDARDEMAAWLHKHGIPLAECAEALDEFERVILLPSMSPLADHCTTLSAEIERKDALLADIASRLTDQSDEPWLTGSESARLHYWRDKAINAAREICTLSQQEQGNGQ